MSDTRERMTRVLDEAMRIANAKNESYQDAWRDEGWRGSLGKILTKATRLKRMLWRTDTPLMNGQSETPRETAIDMINHLVFFVLNLDDGREWGHEPNPPIHTNPGVRVEGQWTPEHNRLTNPDATVIQPHAGDNPFDLGEPPSLPEPSPQPRGRRGDRGSGPRKVTDSSKS